MKLDVVCAWATSRSSFEVNQTRCRKNERMLAASQQQKSGIKNTISFDFPWWQQQQQTTILNYILALPCFKTRKCCCGFCHSQKIIKNYTTFNDSSKTIISLALSAVVCGVSFFLCTALSFLWKFSLSSERQKNIDYIFLSERKNC